MRAGVENNIQILQNEFIVDVLERNPGKRKSSKEKRVAINFDRHDQDTASFEIIYSISADAELNLSITNSSENIHTRLSMETKILTPNIRRTKLNLLLDMTEEFEIVISTLLKNGTFFQQTQPYTLDGVRILPAYINTINETFGCVFHPDDSMQVVQALLPTTSTARVHLTISSWELTPVEDKCSFRLLTKTEAVTTCGIRAFSAIKNKFQISVSIIISPIQQRCMLGTNMNITLADEEGTTTTNVIRSSIFLSFNGDDFPLDEITPDIAVNDQSVLFVNDIVTLKCIAKPCEYSPLAWCQGNNKFDDCYRAYGVPFEEDSDSSDTRNGSFLDDPSIRDFTHPPSSDVISFEQIAFFDKRPSFDIIFTSYSGSYTSWEMENLYIQLLKKFLEFENR